jgi:hypothetical protein
MPLGVLEGRAVVKTPDGKTQVLRLGDKIAGTNAIVSQIQNGSSTTTARLSPLR